MIRSTLPALGMLTLVVSLVLGIIWLAGAPFFDGWPWPFLFIAAVFLVVSEIVVLAVGFSLILRILINGFTRGDRDGH